MAFDVGILLTGITRVIFNRKYWKRVVLGEFETTSEEWGQISDFLDSKLIKELSDLNELSYSDKLRMKIQLKQVPILKQLTLEEVAFLYSKKVDLDTYFDIVIAKGDFIQGFREIEWDKNGYVIKERNKLHDAFFVGLSSAVVCGLFLGIGMFISFSIPWFTSVIDPFWVVGFVTILGVCFWIPIASMPGNFKLALKRLQETEQFSLIFKNAKPK